MIYFLRMCVNVSCCLVFDIQTDIESLSILMGNLFCKSLSALFQGHIMFQLKRIHFYK